MQKLFWLPVVALLLLFSCQKEEVNAFNEKKLDILPFNSKNVFDQAGVIHNAILYKVIDNKKNLISLDDYVDYSHYVLKNNFNIEIQNSQNSTNYSTNAISSDVQLILDDAVNNYFNVVDRSSHSEIVKIKLKEFINLLLTYEHDVSVDYDFIYGEILEFENQILTDSNMIQNDKDEIMQITSIGRFSAFMWYNEYQKSLISGNLNFNGGISTERSWWKWLSVAVADVAGGIAGAVIGSPTGIGAIAGSVGGAVSTSAGAASLVDWISPDN